MMSARLHAWRAVPPVGRWRVLACVAGAALGLRWGAGCNPGLVERVYSRGVYPSLVKRLVQLTGAVSTSVAEWALLLVLGAGLVFLLRLGLRWRRQGPPTRVAVVSGLAGALLGTATVYLLFLLLWGLNYTRVPLAQSLGLQIRPAPPGELVSACRESLAAAALLRGVLAESEAGALRLAGGVDAALRRADLGYLELDEPLLRGSYGLPKAAAASSLLSQLGIAGIYSPFTGEAHVNVDVPEAGLPFAACHELAHLRGFAREDEANYVGYLACRAHPDPHFQYSAHFEVATYALSALRRVAPERARGLADTAHPGIRRDWEALRSWVRRHAGPARRVSRSVNDVYLKSQGLPDGVQSYGRMLDLLLAARRARDAAQR